MNPITPYNFPEQVAYRVQDLLVQHKVLHYSSGIAFYVWQRGERLIVAFDPGQIRSDRINDSFVHELSTRLHGRKVVRTNSRGMFLQVGFDVPPAPYQLESGTPLDLKQQPDPWHMPIGLTAEGPLWISLIDGDSFLIGGRRRSGKSGLVHGMLQALLQGGRTQVYAWDGKAGAEFGRYLGSKNFHFIHSAQQGLDELSNLLAERLHQLRSSGYPNIIMHNDAGKDFIEPVALFVDEIAELEDDLKVMLKGMVKLYGASGLYPVLATNDPTQASILVKTNLATRICFDVPSYNDSLTVLGMKGAESLSSRGRGLIVWEGRLTEFQTYHVDYPIPSEETLRLLSAQVAGNPQNPEGERPDPVNDQIAELIKQGDGDAAIVRKVWKVTSGNRFYKLREQVAAIRKGTSSTSSSSISPVLGLEGAG